MQQLYLDLAALFAFEFSDSSESGNSVLRHLGQSIWSFWGSGFRMRD